jgi:hypothetical protein
MPNGGRYWRYNYRFEGKHKTLALGVHPDISLDKAIARHQIARTLLADGVDPSTQKRGRIVRLTTSDSRAPKAQDPEPRSAY